VTNRWSSAHIASVVDLTDLSDECTVAAVDALCAEAILRNVAAVCVWPQFVEQAARHLSGSTVAVATVLNFPHGDAAPSSLIGDANDALAAGATEIDVVIPWRDIIAGTTSTTVAVVAAVATFTRRAGALTKAILETGALEEHGLVERAARLAMDAGADFLKTSTGKIDKGASIESARVLLNVAQSATRDVGVKVSGRIRTRDQAEAYLDLVAAIRGEGTSDDYLLPEVPALPAFSLQRAVSTMIRDLGFDYWTGTVYTTNRRVWEHDDEFKEYLRQTRAMAIDMETATIFAAGFANRIPSGALLLVSDQPMVPEGVKTEDSDKRVTSDFVDAHIRIGIEALRLIRRHGKSVKHLRFDE
jgi:predicted AMP nucleosidase